VTTHSLKSRNLSGYGGITSTILKACASLISGPLTHICNHSLFTDIFPAHLKTAIVKRLYKRGDKMSMTNYGPVSLLTTFSKVPHKVMYNRLSRYLQTNNILVPEQYGFRKGIFTENAAFKQTVLENLF
jgi:hypothetical protein